MSFTTTMLDKSAPEIELLRAAYAAFNAQDIDAALATMTSDVAFAERDGRRLCPWTSSSSRLLDEAIHHPSAR